MTPESLQLYKLIILYFLNQADQPMPNAILSDFILETGYTVKNSILNEKLAKLAPEDRSKIYEVIDTLLKHSKQIAP